MTQVAAGSLWSLIYVEPVLEIFQNIIGALSLMSESFPANICRSLRFHCTSGGKASETVSSITCFVTPIFIATAKPYRGYCVKCYFVRIIALISSSTTVIFRTADDQILWLVPTHHELHRHYLHRQYNSPNATRLYQRMRDSASIIAMIFTQEHHFQKNTMRAISYRLFTL